DFTVQKAVELGVSRIQPLATGKSVVRLGDERAAKRVQHWQRVVIAACEQCGRNRVPAVEKIADLTEWLTRLSPNDCESRWQLSPDGSQTLRDLKKPDPVLLLCGPESGFTQEEEDAAQRAGFVTLKLGPRTLRTETAAITALAAMQAQWGDL
ncbi:MAG: 16S rRNA (uracil(1498)-N(3))-methyltransferase, partial [Burkholderiales bacterium]